MTKCMSCFDKFAKNDYSSFAQHFIDKANESDGEHIKYLNKYITKKKVDKNDLEKLLKQFFDTTERGLEKWVKRRFVEKFYSDPPHPFIQALQKPSRATLLGYVFEHQHFLRQWVRSCSFIIAKTPYIDVTEYEIENIMTEFGGIRPDIPSHYEYLLRMGESLGVTRNDILETEPLPDTQKAIDFWHEQAENGHWLETMLAMHSLELIAYRDIKDEGASMTYFDPSILENDKYTEDTKIFLREGYEADVGHANEALELVEKYATQDNMVEEVQATFMKSMEMFDIYLRARLERAKQFE